MNHQLHVIDYSVFNYACRNSKIGLDIGANIGGMTNSMLGAGCASVHSFEPVPDQYAQLFDRYKDNPAVVCNNVGLSDHAHILNNITVLEAWTLGTPKRGVEGTEAGSIDLATCPEYLGKPYFDVSFITLDQYIESHDLGGKTKRVGVVKLDVDGYELRVLKGGRNFFLTQQPFIMIELSCYIAKVGDSIEDYISYIFELGYDIFSMDGQNVFRTWKHIEPQYPFHSSFDVILVPKRMAFSQEWKKAGFVSSNFWRE